MKLEPGSRHPVADLESGEVMFIAVPKRRRHEGGFFMGYQEGFKWLASQDIKGEALRVLIYLFSQLDYENFIRVPQKQVGEALGLHKSNVSKAVKELEQLGVIHRGPMAGKSYTFRLDPNLGWRGRAAARDQAKREASKKGLQVIAGGQRSVGAGVTPGPAKKTR